MNSYTRYRLLIKLLESRKDILDFREKPNMIEIERTILKFFRFKEVYYAKTPYNIPGFRSLRYYCCSNKIDIRGFKRKLTATLIIDLKNAYLKSGIIWINHHVDTLLDVLKEKG
jgi:hypothetical protein